MFSCTFMRGKLQTRCFFRKVATRHPKPQVISFNASISSCEKANHWQQALEIFDEMLTDLAPDVITCSALMSCCEKAGQWQQADHRIILFLGKQIHMFHGNQLAPRQDFATPLLACQSSAGKQILMFFQKSTDSNCFGSTFQEIEACSGKSTISG